MSLKWGRFQTLHMRQEGEKTKWAFDTRPDDGGPPRPVYIGNMQDWDPSETRTKRWTTPITPGATKAVWGQTTFQVARYRCCHDLNNCGVRVKVRQGNINAWNFAREWSYGFKHAPRNSCINKRQYAGESRFHLMTKLNIARILRAHTWLEFYNIKEVYLEKFVQSVPDIKPDVHYITNDNQTIIIEVVVTNAPNRYKHDQFGSDMVLINLKELDVTRNDSIFDNWVKSGGIEGVLQKELALERRTHLSSQRDQHFAQVDQAQWEREMREFESKCRERFGFGLASLNMDIKDFVNQEEMEKIFQTEGERLKLLNELEAAEIELIEAYKERLELRLEEFETVDELKNHYRKILGAKIKQKRKEERKRRKRMEKEQVARYVIHKTEEFRASIDPTFREVEREFNTTNEVDEYFAAEVIRFNQRKEERRHRIERYSLELRRCESEFGFESITLVKPKDCTNNELDDLGRIQRIFEEEHEKRKEIDTWHAELNTEFGFSMNLYLAGLNYFENIHELRSRYVREVRERKQKEIIRERERLLRIKRAKEIEETKKREHLHFMNKELVANKQLYPALSELFDVIDQDAILSLGRPREAYKKELNIVIKETKVGTSLLGSEFVQVIEEFKELITESNYLRYLFDIEHLKPILWDDIVRKKYGDMFELQSAGWRPIVHPGSSSSPNTRPANRYNTVAREMITSLKNAMSELQFWEPKLKRFFESIEDSLGMDRTLASFEFESSGIFKICKIDSLCLLNEAGKCGIRFRKHKKSMTITEMVDDALNSFFDIALIFHPEMTDEWKVLATKSEQAYEAWESFLSLIPFSYYSPKVTTFEMMGPYVQSSLKVLRNTRTRLPNVMTKDGVRKNDPMATEIDRIATLQDRLATKIERATTKIQMITQPLNQDLKSFLSAHIAECLGKVNSAIEHLETIKLDLADLLLSCDDVSRKIKPYRVTFRENKISFRDRPEVYQQVNYSTLFKPFPSLERKFNLLVGSKEDISNLTYSEMNTLFLERAATRGWDNPKMKPLLPLHKSNGPRNRRKDRKKPEVDHLSKHKLQIRDNEISDWKMLLQFFDYCSSPSSSEHVYADLFEAVITKDFSMPLLRFYRTKEGNTIMPALIKYLIPMKQA